MSRFTRNRKKAKLSQATLRALQKENEKKFDKAMETHIKTCRIIKERYPGYTNMNPKNALDLYHKIYNELRNEQSK